MPWETKKNGDQYCVYVKGASTPIKGGCHDTRDEAVKHVQALYVNAKKHMHLALPISAFSDVVEDTDDPNVKWVQAWRYSSWDHPQYGKVEVTPALVSKFKTHLDNNTYGQDILANYEHGTDPAKGNKAAGKVLDIEAREDGGWYKVEFTPTALKEIEDGEWRYISPEYSDWMNAETGETFEDVPVGLAICNRPFFKNMAPINFSELYTEVDEHNEQQEDDGDMDPLLKAFAEMLGIELEEDTSNEDALKLFSEKVTELKETDTGDDDDGDGDGDEGGTEAEKQFIEAFPEQAQELAQLRKMRIANEAKAFAEQFSSIKVKEGDKEVTKGLSTAAKDKLIDVHLKFSEGTATPEDVAEVVKSVVASGVVEFGERGSSASGDDVPTNSRDAATRLRDRAKQLIAEAGGNSKMSFGDALAKASEEHPELAKAYSERG
jgi:phage I-like protein